MQNGRGSWRRGGGQPHALYDHERASDTATGVAADASTAHGGSSFGSAGGGQPKGKGSGAAAVASKGKGAGGRTPNGKGSGDAPVASKGKGAGGGTAPDGRSGDDPEAGKGKGAGGGAASKGKGTGNRLAGDRPLTADGTPGEAIEETSEDGAETFAGVPSSFCTLKAEAYTESWSDFGASPPSFPATLGESGYGAKTTSVSTSQGEGATLAGAARVTCCSAMCVTGWCYGWATQAQAPTHKHTSRQTFWADLAEEDDWWNYKQLEQFGIRAVPRDTMEKVVPVPQAVEQEVLWQEPRVTTQEEAPNLAQGTGQENCQRGARPPSLGNQEPATSAHIAVWQEPAPQDQTAAQEIGKLTVVEPQMSVQSRAVQVPVVMAREDTTQAPAPLVQSADLPKGQPETDPPVENVPKVQPQRGPEPAAGQGGGCDDGGEALPLPRPPPVTTEQEVVKQMPVPQVQTPQQIGDVPQFWPDVVGYECYSRFGSSRDQSSESEEDWSENSETDAVYAARVDELANRFLAEARAASRAARSKR